MLKVTVQEKTNAIAIKLEGAVAGDWVPELVHSWHSVESYLDGKEFSIDLCDVTYVDREGQKVLAEIYGKSRAKFLADRPLTQYFAERAMRSGSTEKNGGTRK